MLHKNVNATKTTKGKPNYSVGYQKRKNASAQTSTLNLENCFYSISIDGKISKDDQNNYKKAIDFLNKWNNTMREYLKKKTCKWQEAKALEYLDGNLYIASIPNYMSIFLTLQELNYKNLNKKPIKKNIFTQTIHSEKKVVVVDVKSQTQYIGYSKQSDSSHWEIIPKRIQQEQYGTYPEKNFEKYCDISRKAMQLPQLTQSLTFSEKKSTSSVREEDLVCHYRESQTNMYKNKKLGSFSASASRRGKFKRAPTGFLSPNGMMASEINANCTPLVVREMFEKMQKPNEVLMSKSNILKNISRSDSSGSSVILSDKEDLENDGLEKIYSPFVNQDRYVGENFVNSQNNHHPLNLNERDLNTKDKELISSIGIFTEDGELKQNAKNYIETNKEVRRGTFRTPRLSQLHMVKNYNAKSYTSDSFLSDVLSNRSSDFED